MRYQYNKRFFKITDENQKIFKKIKSHFRNED